MNGILSEANAHKLHTQAGGVASPAAVEVWQVIFNEHNATLVKYCLLFAT